MDGPVEKTAETIYIKSERDAAMHAQRVIWTSPRQQWPHNVAGIPRACAARRDRPV